eukprot:CAMPEP_0172401474 /NCGR_PEP_ID=MMETSP1061-20121228/50397_1 /TAXON_ID=37318 /ORGANISM="Pseudo-nitzschia pungens, Strain cf. pungens" /LENGTH=51 /DNA_ID=CAMNT_0013135121 /DNA_START=56 /DNA_END=208 /DNA_ORIENTATION=+
MKSQRSDRPEIMDPNISAMGPMAARGDGDGDGDGRSMEFLRQKRVHFRQAG